MYLGRMFFNFTAVIADLLSGMRSSCKRGSQHLLPREQQFNIACGRVRS